MQLPEPNTDSSRDRYFLNCRYLPIRLQKKGRPHLGQVIDISNFLTILRRTKISEIYLKCVAGNDRIKLFFNGGLPELLYSTKDMHETNARSRGNVITVWGPLPK